MASLCFNVWRVHVNSKGVKKWVNEGPAPDGVCPSCPNSTAPARGTWNGFTAACQNGAIVKMVADGAYGLMIGETILPASDARAQQACNGSTYRGTGAISSYFP